MCEILQSVKNELALIEDMESTNTEVRERGPEVYESAKPALLSLPVEIFLKICSFLDANFLKNTLSKVCTRFNDILSDEHMWKSLVHSKISGIFPPIPDLKVLDAEPINWVEVCVDMELETKKWRNVTDEMQHLMIKDVHFASVDTVLLCNRGDTCISGGRDRVIALWNVADVEHCYNKVKSQRHVQHDAHAGWVWDLACDNTMNTSLIYSASWDNTVKAWDLISGFQCVETFRCGMSALSVVTCDNIALVGLYSKKVLSFDIRVGPEPINTYKPHKGPVLALHTYKNYVASISEDKTLAIWDRVAGKLIAHEVKIPTEKAYPVCISWTPLSFYVGDSKGSLHLFHPEEFKYIKTYEVWPESPVTKPSYKITTCIQTPGNMVVCSDRGEIKFFYNGYPPCAYASVQSKTFDVTQLRYVNGVLVVGTCDSALEYWIPKGRFPDLPEPDQPEPDLPEPDLPVPDLPEPNLPEPVLPGSNL